jgi:PTS system nitrogen regulatory IIA component
MIKQLLIGLISMSLLFSCSEAETGVIGEWEGKTERINSNGNFVEVNISCTIKASDGVNKNVDLSVAGINYKFDAIEEIISNCQVFEFLDKCGSKDKFIQEVFDRESLETTGIGHNVGIPHGKCDIIDNVCIGLGISREGIDFGSIDGESVHLILVIGSNPGNQMEYLKSLAFIMNHLKNPFLRSALINLSFSNNQENEGHYSQFINIMKSQIFSS